MDLEVREDKEEKENHASFLRRFELKITPADLLKLDFAYDLAKYGHRDQQRDSGERYFEHLRAVALIIVDELGILDAEIISASLLHDMMEDNFLLNPERLQMIFGERVMNLVAALTKPKMKGFPSRQARNSFYFFQQIIAGGAPALIIKLADRLHNLRTLGACSPAKQRSKLKETKTYCLPLLDRLSQTHPEVAVRLKEAISAAIRYREAKLATTSV